LTQLTVGTLAAMKRDSVPPSLPRFQRTVLVVDHAGEDVAVLSTVLKAEGFDVHHAHSALTALNRARVTHPDAVILEVDVPGTEDFGLLPWLREHRIGAPGLFLTARAGLQDRVTGLTVGGGDDYIVKPFHAEEVVARLRAVLRRNGLGVSPSDYVPLVCSDLELNLRNHEVQKTGKTVALSATEFELLRFLMANEGIILSKRTIIDNVWSCDFRGDSAVVESVVHRLRRKVDRGDERLLHTVRGLGYVLRAPRPARPRGSTTVQASPICSLDSYR
jgi:two-component system OmpR family response regulator